MWIISQDGSLSIPYNGARLKMKDSYTTQIIAIAPNGNGITVAEYGDYDRARQILRELTINNENRRTCWTYYMPAD